MCGGLGGFSLFKEVMTIKKHIKAITWDDITKVWQYIMKKGEVSKTQLQRDFSHRLTAEELDEIIYFLGDAQRIGSRHEQSRRYYYEYYPYPGWRDKKRGRKWRTTYVEIVLKGLREQENLGTDKERELNPRGINVQNDSQLSK